MTKYFDKHGTIGWDRYGNEIRVGDRVRRMGSSDSLVVTRRENVTGNSGDFAFFGAETWGIFETAAELVTDEKTPRCGRSCTRCGETSASESQGLCDECEKVESMEQEVGRRAGEILHAIWENTVAELARSEQREVGPACDALESLCRALAGPTRAERFEAFKDWVRAALLDNGYERSIPVVFDLQSGVPIALFTLPHRTKPALLKDGKHAPEVLGSMIAHWERKVGASVLGKGER